MSCRWPQVAHQPFPVLRLYEEAEAAVKRAKERLPAEERLDPSRQGGLFTAAVEKPDQTTIYPTVQMLEVPEDRKPKRRRLSREKVLRLLGHPEHTSSRQSRDPDREMFGGAKRYRSPNGVHYVFGFSGFKEDDDDLVPDELAYALGLEEAPLVAEPVAV